VTPKLLRGSDTGIVFMLHRFPDQALGNDASHDIRALREWLAYFRRRKLELIPLATMFERAAAGEPLHGAVAFTIDDGYRDHATVGAPLFAEFDCPATTFVTTGFLDGAVWFWWDKIEYVLRTTHHRKLSVHLSDARSPLVIEWNSDGERGIAQERLIEAFKRIPEEEKTAGIARLASTAEVELSARPPAVYAPMTWSEARKCESTGMTFGPHTVTHPILARTSDAQSKFEIEESWRRLSAEVAHPVPVFCYPNGQPSDFGEREEQTIAGLGLRGAVVGSPGYATGDSIRGQPSRYRVRRFGMPGDTGGFAQVVQFVTGIEMLKERLLMRQT
jgi:peptidoglycan/xylan/chitin deacetylase (PgdA/CDA1 family)